MIHIGLFEGIGGFSLASEQLGWNTYVHCEIDDFPSHILKFFWPDVYHHKDIHTLTYKIIDEQLTKRHGPDWRNQPIIVTGGFPCQPFSNAGQKGGSEDNRYLWPEMLRVIDEIRPDWVCGENVNGITNMVQPYTQVGVEGKADLFQESEEEVIIEEGEYVVETICGDLERIGYSVQPIVIPACAIGAPHRRDRIWFIAHSDRGLSEYADKEVCSRGNTSDDGVTSDTGSEGLSGCQFDGASDQGKRSCEPYLSITEPCQGNHWWGFPTVAPLCNGDDGLSTELDVSALYDKPPKKIKSVWTRWKNYSIKAGGNAIVPQVFLEIGKAIQLYEDSRKDI